MEKLDDYRAKVQQIIAGYVKRLSTSGDDSLEAVFDTTHDHYLLVEAGWRGERRNYGSLIHIDIKNQKIWIQHDGTEVGVANELIDMGIPKEDIVLGFHSPFMRQHTEFAVG
ncbi:MAG: XisI protein [Caldilineaceae bacterium]